MPQEPHVPNIYGSYYRRQREAAIRDIAAVVAELERQGVGGATSDVKDVAIRGVGFYQETVGGAVYWSRSTNAHFIDNRILNRYRQLGADSSFLGYPVTHNAFASDNVGMFSNFEHGSIYWTPRTGGAYEVSGPILDKWASLGREQSYLGYPTSGEQDAPGGGRISYFERGSIRVTQGVAVPSDPPPAPPQPSGILSLNVGPTELILNTLRITGVTWVVTPRWAPGSSQTVNGANATVTLPNPPSSSNNIVDVNITVSGEVAGWIDGFYFPYKQIPANVNRNPQPLGWNGTNLTVGWLATWHIVSNPGVVAEVNINVTYQGAQ